MLANAPPLQWLRLLVVAAIKVKFTLNNIKIEKARRHPPIIRHSRRIHIPISRSPILRTIQAILIDFRYISKVLFRQKLELVLWEIIPRPGNFAPIGCRIFALVRFADDSETEVQVVAPLGTGDSFAERDFAVFLVFQLCVDVNVPAFEFEEPDDEGLALKLAISITY